MDRRSSVRSSHATRRAGSPRTRSDESERPRQPLNDNPMIGVFCALFLVVAMLALFSLVTGRSAIPSAPLALQAPETAPAGNEQSLVANSAALGSNNPFVDPSATPIPPTPAPPAGYSAIPVEVTDGRLAPDQPGSLHLSAGQPFRLLECRVTHCRVEVLPPGELWVTRDQLGLPPATPTPIPPTPIPPTPIPPTPTPFCATVSAADGQSATRCSYVSFDDAQRQASEALFDAMTKAIPTAGVLIDPTNAALLEELHATTTARE